MDFDHCGFWFFFVSGGEGGCINFSLDSFYNPRAPMTSIFEGRGPTKTKPKFQSKQGAPFGFQENIKSNSRPQKDRFEDDVFS